MKKVVMFIKENISASEMVAIPNNFLLIFHKSNFLHCEVLHI